MEDFPKVITTGEKYGPAMQLASEQEAKEYLAKCIRHSMSLGYSQEESEEIEKANIGYYAGYYSEDTRARVERLFSCAHPVFGPVANH